MQLPSQVEHIPQPLIDVAHSSINFNQYTQASLTPLYSLTENKAYIPIPSCILEHIIATTNLSNIEKLYFILVYSLELTRSGLEKKKAIALSADNWAKRLGCSRAKIFAMQKSLVKKGYFFIESGKGLGEHNHNIRNLITPALPDSVFEQLSKTDNKTGEHLPYKALDPIESKINYLNRTKLFIPLNYQLLKLLTANNALNPMQKIFWLDFYSRSYKCHKFFDKMQLKDGDFGTNIINGINHSFYFVSSYQELAAKYACDKKYLSKILNALETTGFIAKQRVFTMKDKIEQRRQDQSLWKITLLLPHNCVLELQKVKDRINKDALKNDAKTPNLNIKQEKNNIIGNKSDIPGEVILDNTDLRDSQEDLGYKHEEEKYVDSVIDELEPIDDIPNICDDISSIDETPYLTASNDTVAVYDHEIAKFRLLYKKDSLINIQAIKSNLSGLPKVIFNKFLNNFDFNDDHIKRKKLTKKEFSICSTLIREKIKKLPKDKVDKAKKFAYSLISKKLAIGYAATLNKHELAKQFIYHIASWKPTNLGSISQENEIDTALSVAWKAAVSGTWKIPLGWAKAQILEFEFRAYKQKYQLSGVLSADIPALEKDVSRLLGSWYDLTARITEGTETTTNNENLPALMTQQNYLLEDENEYNPQSFFSSDSYSSSESKTHYLDDLPEEKNQQPYVSEFLNNYELYQKLERQGYFDIKFTEDSMLFKTNLVNNQKYLPVINDLKVNGEDVYVTLKFTKQTLYESDTDIFNLEQQNKSKFLN